jgi:hypothetical protein
LTEWQVTYPAMPSHEIGLVIVSFGASFEEFGFAK